MQFDSLAQALAMDGHGSYVWSVALVSTLVILGLLLLPVLRSRRTMNEQRGALRREQAQVRSKQANAPGS